MGMTIEEKFKTLQDEYTYLMGKYLMMQADYETRLKADLEAILVELQLEIEEKRREEEFMNDWNNGYNSCLVDGYNLIQQKINALGDKADVSDEK